MSKLRPISAILLVTAAVVTTAVVVQHPCNWAPNPPTNPQPASEPEALDSSGGSAG